ncbi:MAG: class I SAM-dependent methyltransferase [Chloroflexota bacterium]
MHPDIQERLLQLNRTFYETVAEPFHFTRKGLAPGLFRLLNYFPEFSSSFHLADIGCGNGRFAHVIDQVLDERYEEGVLKGERGNGVYSITEPDDQRAMGEYNARKPKASDVICHYVGADANQPLMDYGASNMDYLSHVQGTFRQINLGKSGWSETVGRVHPAFDIVTCLATLHHMPGYQMRAAIFRELGSLLKPNGLLMISCWQFFDSPKLVKKMVDWQEIGLSEADVEPGDGLVPWTQGVYAVRYAHQISHDELVQLTDQANLNIVEEFRSDGRTDNLSRYAVMRKKE